MKRLAASGDRICVAVRDIEGARFLKPMGDVGQVVPILANIRDDESVNAAVQGADAVITSVGVLFNRGRQTFESIHVDGAERVAKAAASAGVKRLVHISALGADIKSSSTYARSKAEGEVRVMEAFPRATMVRPGVVFGSEDQFFNKFAALFRLVPALPIFGDGLFDAGSSKLQPVYVGDVAKAIVHILDDVSTAGEMFELGGPQTYTYKEIMELVLQQTGRQRLLVPVPFWAARIVSAVFELLPTPPLTRDQLKLLAEDNVVSDDVKRLSDLGLTGSSVEGILPQYLGRYRRRAARNPVASA